VIKSLYLKAEELETRIMELDQKYQRAERELVEYEASGLADAEVVFVAYGSTARITAEAIELLAADGIKAGLIRPISLWPFPYEAFDRIPRAAKAVISVELSRGQMLDDVKIGCNGRFAVGLSSRVGGVLITPPEIAADAKKALEVYHENCL
jgi:2-oxoglutarate ferredoxin oxidoreductase subunit alpha